MNGLIYDALMLGRNKNTAREEYLFAADEKEAVRFEAEEKNIRFSDVVSDVTGIIHLKMTVAGYAEIEVYSEDAILQFDKKVISSEEFRDEKLDFTFTVLAEKLHNGKNFARITFRNPICSTCVDIVVDNSVRIGYAETSSRKRLALLERQYIDLRLGNLFQTEWQEKTLSILDKESGGNTSDMFLMLYKANVLITCERFDEAAGLIEFVGSQMKKLKEEEWELACYYYYITSLYEMDPEVTEEMLGRVRTVYEMHPSWMILWILFYMDEELSNSPKDIAEMIEGEFLIRDCNSPVMYYEATEAFRKEPELITEPSKFVIHTLNFAAREDFLNIACAARFAEVIWHTDNRVLAYSNLDACVRILKNAYDRFNSNIILKSLCKVLICAGEKGQEYHRYYEAAVKGFLDTNGLYEYFICSSETDRFIAIPEQVLEFYSGREYELGESRYYYFACLIKRKDEYKKYCDEARGNMIRSAYEALDRGLISTSLAVIYRELMDEGLLGEDRYSRMLEILYTREVVTSNPLVVSVLVFHREFGEYQEAELTDGKALVRLFTRDAIVLFKDTAGNLYYNIDYVFRRFMPHREYTKMCIERSGITRYMLVGDSLDILRQTKSAEDILNWLYGNIGKGRLRSSYEQEILQDLIVYFSERSEDERVVSLLLDFLDFNLEDETRARLIELMIDRLMYKEACIEIGKHGAACVSDKSVAALVHVLAELTDYADDDLLEELACRAFLNTESDPVIFRYMCRQYDGDLNVLILMYVAAKADGIDDITIAERVLRKSVQENVFPEECESIFADYFANGSDTQLKKDFESAAAAAHLFGGNSRFEYIFKYIESTFDEQEKLPDIAAVAYLMYMRTQSSLEKRSIRITRERLTDLVRRGIMLEEFKDYRKYFDIPASLANSYTAEKILRDEDSDTSAALSADTMFGSAPKITFTLKQREGTISNSEAMKEVVPGIYIRNFTLFFGESLEYTVDEGRRCVITYHDLKITDDGSRFARLDRMIRDLHGIDEEKLAGEAREYQRLSMLMDRLF